ncbi:MAG: class I SAM-dependent methyltransferase [Alphaproteobacteria bacterium]|nr:class I SAM-dependent methyltransferase [Alphaproteobacteria bacterium]MBV9418811.1 class I SAM-dependent methyltransferase [Alphaproteobacteria bacterium]MBV9542268.1 class I SAM-dependent methyltransferase [Alphaproteobacteria bacterium]
MIDSIAYYDRNGAAFFAGSVNADMATDRARFLKHVPSGGAILEAGCGSGRDALAFKQAGYAVTAIDGSAEMVRRASEHTGLTVQHKRFDQVDWRNAFDGIWSCASLLHVQRADLPDAMARLVRALKPGGVWYMSFKYGDHEAIVHERHFTYMTEPMLTAAIRAQDLELIDLWTSEDVRPERKGETWLGAIVRKPA